MIVVTAELWPGGDSSRARPIGKAFIVNNGTSSKGTVGNYQGRIFSAGQKPLTLREFHVKGFRRKKFGVWYLLGRILQTAFEIEKAWVPET